MHYLPGSTRQYSWSVKALVHDYPLYTTDCLSTCHKLVYIWTMLTNNHCYNECIFFLLGAYLYTFTTAILKIAHSVSRICGFSSPVFPCFLHCNSGFCKQSMKRISTSYWSHVAKCAVLELVPHVVRLRHGCKAWNRFLRLEPADWG